MPTLRASWSYRGAASVRFYAESEPDKTVPDFRISHLAHAEGRHPALMLADILAPRFDVPDDVG